jgi:PBP1b-binding outer membrane lipoprotein LpoB
MRRAFIVALGLATALVLAGCTLFYPNSGAPEDTIEPSASQTEDSSNPETPTESASPSPSVSTTMAPATLQIIYSDASGGVLNVVAEVTNFAEDGGNCVLSYFQGDAASILATVKAERNVTTTQCFPFNVDLASLPKGAMTLMVSYESANHLGESEKFEVIIP